MKHILLSFSVHQDRQDAGEVIRTAVAAGFDGIDWLGTYGVTPCELARQCADAGVPAVGYTFFVTGLQRGETAWDDELERNLDRAAGLGVSRCMLGTPDLPGADSRAAARPLWMPVFRKFVQGASARKMVAMVENYPDCHSPVLSADDYAEVIASCPSLMLTWDPGNEAGIEPLDACWRRFSSRIRNVHLKDWITVDGPGDETRRMPDGRYFKAMLLGQGNIGMEKVVRALVEGGYDGPVSIEYESRAIPTLQAMKMALQWLKAQKC